jgi:hypothetical protein
VALRLLADVDISFWWNCCSQILGRTMELGRSAADADVGFAWLGGDSDARCLGSDRFRRIICSRNGKRMHTLGPRDDFADGVNDVRVAGAATQIAAHPLANLGMR